jgi:hypothetical protein
MPRLDFWRGCPSSPNPRTGRVGRILAPVQALPLQPPQNGEAIYANDCTQSSSSDLKGENMDPETLLNIISTLTLY